MVISLRGTLLAFLILGPLAGCENNPAEPDQVTIADFVGTWSWNVGNINSSCGSEAPWQAQVVITQVGASATEVVTSSRWRADDPGPFEFPGTVSGNTLTIPDVTYTEDSGTLTATHTVTLQVSGNMEGQESWTWTNAGGTCSGGTADILAVRTGP